ncbi:MAG: hypothetical protein MK291_07500 [Planctomycetes bacterium]|nr:hypothetical protein [Planctomycetota bacterium]
MAIQREKRGKNRTLILGGACLLFAAVIAGLFSALGTDDHAELEVPVSVFLEDEPMGLEGGGGLEVDSEERQQVALSGGDEREVLVAGAQRDATFSGKVEDRVSLDGLAGAGVKVVVGEETILGTADAGGAFELRVPEGAPLSVEVSAAGYNPSRRSGVDSDQEAVFRLDRSSTLRGKVIGPGGEELAVTEVHITADDRREERLLELRPDELGQFEVVGLEPGEFNVAAWAPGWSFDVQRDIIVRPGDETYVVLELIRAGSASAQVVFEGTTKGVPGVEVEVEPWVQGLPREVEDIVLLKFETDELGLVDLESLNPGENRVRLYADWGEIRYAPRLLVESGEHQRLTWSIPAQAACGGVLLDAGGQPAEGMVWITPTPQRRGGREALEEQWEERMEWPLRQPTGSDGRFFFPEVPTSVSLRLSGTLGVDEAPPLDFGFIDKHLKAGETATDLELRLAQEQVITGQVLDSEEEPVSDASVSTWGVLQADAILDEVMKKRVQGGGGELKTSGFSVKTDEEGRFMLTGLVTERSGVIVRHERFRTNYEELKGGAPKEPLLIYLQENRGVSGRVVDEYGDAVPWARVSGSRGNERRRSESTYADEFGRFQFKSLREGTWKFYGSLSGYERVETLEVEVPFEGEITLKMKRSRTPDPATIRGLALLPDGEAPARLRMQRLHSAAMSVDGGEFRINGLSPGAHNFVLEASGCAPRSLGELVLREGEERDVGVVRMYPGIQVEVEVREERPLPGERGSSLSGARVRMEPVGGYAVEAGRGTRRPGRSRRGDYPMGTLELGEWRLSVRLDGYARYERTITLQPGREREIKVELEKQQ